MSISPEDYEKLVGYSRETNFQDFRKHHTQSSWHSSGLPLAIFDEVKRRGEIFSDVYEKLYDARKAQMQKAGGNCFPVIKDDFDNLVAVNFPALVTIPVFWQALRQGDNLPFIAPILHWMRWSERDEWIFSHLCLAIYGYFSVHHLRQILGPDVETAFEDLRDSLQDALYYYNHRPERAPKRRRVTLSWRGKDTELR